MVKIKIKKLVKESVIPKYAKNGDGAMDLVATSKNYDEHGNVVYGTGLAFEIPKGYVGLLFPRSSNAKKDLLLSNSVGVLDSGYRGEVMMKFKPSLYEDMCEEQEKYRFGGALSSVSEYELRERIGQLIIMPYPQIEFEEVEELSLSERGSGGYGSSGK